MGFGSIISKKLGWFFFCLIVVHVVDLLTFQLFKILFHFELAGSTLAAIIAEGGEKLMKYLNSGAVKELRDVIPHYDDLETVMDDSDSEDNEVGLFIRKNNFYKICYIFINNNI